MVGWISVCIRSVEFCRTRLIKQITEIKLGRRNEMERGEGRHEE